MSRTWPTEEEWARWRLEQASARAEAETPKRIDWDGVQRITAKVLRNVDRNGAFGSPTLEAIIREHRLRMEAEYGPDWREISAERYRKMLEYNEHDQDHQLTWGE